MKIELYQIDENSDFEGVKFASLSTLYKIDTPVDPEIYKKTYDGEVDCHSLEEVFAMFNLTPPTDFKSHSMSVSDVVAVIGEETEYYYCDTSGFEKIEFDASKAIENKITVVMCEPDKLAYVTQIENNLEGLQGAVGGLVETYYPFPEEVCIVCNDEGKINGMELNRSIVREGKIIEIMAGPFLSATAVQCISKVCPKNSRINTCRCSNILNFSSEQAMKSRLFRSIQTNSAIADFTGQNMRSVKSKQRMVYPFSFQGAP